MVAPFFVLLPLYVYPSTGAWDPIIDSVANHTSVRFKIIINPNNGPGSTSYPDSNYISSIAELNTYSNVDLLGYVHTSWAARNASDITSDISVYANWADYTAANITVNGIFFDEAPTNVSDLTYMRDLAAHAKAVLPAATGNHIVFNTGATTDAKFYSYADTVNAFEGPAPTTYDESSSEAVLAAIPSSLYANSSMILYNYAQNTTQLAADVDTLMDAGVAGMFFTTQADGFRVYSTQWTAFLDAVEYYLQYDVVASSSSSSSTSTAVSSTSTSTSTSTRSMAVSTTSTSTSKSTTKTTAATSTKTTTSTLKTTTSSTTKKMTTTTSSSAKSTSTPARAKAKTAAVKLVKAEV